MTDGDTPVVLGPGGHESTSDDTGTFQFDDINIGLGDNPFVATATDVAGNASTSHLTVRLIEATGPVLIAQLGHDTAPDVQAPASLPCPFDDELNGSLVDERGGSSAGRGSVVAANCHAVLSEGDSFLVTLGRTFEVPDEPQLLSFSYTNLSLATSDRFVKDAFEAALVDGDGNPLIHPIRRGRDAFFNITEGLPAALGTGVSVSAGTVTVDISSLFASTSATLLLRLVNNDADTESTVRITGFDVRSEADLRGVAAPPFAVASVAASGPLTRDDITSDPTVVGTFIGPSAAVALRAGFDATAPNQFIDVLDLADLQSDGTFTLTPSTLEQIFAGPLTDGVHVLHLQAIDETGIASEVFDIAFELDAALPRALIDPPDGSFTQSVDVLYSEAIADAAFAIDSYTVHAERDQGLLIGLDSVERLDGRRARIRFGQPLANRPYVLSIAESVRDLAGNPITPPSTLSFVGTSPLTAVSEIAPFNGEENGEPNARDDRAV